MRTNANWVAVQALAAKGYKLFPVHTPHTNAAGQVTGCSCEEYKRSDKYKAYLDAKGRGGEFNPTYKCENIGKHPRLSDWESLASSDPEQLAKWFARPWCSVDVDTGRKVWAVPNIGLACGPSGVLVLDRDKYKEDYQEIDLTITEQTTITAISGGGGEQLWFAMPADRKYTNSPKGLPPCNDIRGWGGFVVVAPSLHKSGNPYSWEEGYSPADLEPAPIPAPLRSVLDINRANWRRPRQAVTASTAAVERSFTLVQKVLGLVGLVDVSAEEWGDDGHKFILSECPFNPADDPHKEDRGAYVVVHADGAISAGCHHNRCQHRMSESGLSGWQLLKEIAGYAPAEAQASDAFDQLLTAAREWVKQTSFAPFIADKYKARIYQSDKGPDGVRRPVLDAQGQPHLLRIDYRTDGTDTKLVDALLDLAEQSRSFTVYASYETLRHLAGLGSKSTVKAALERLFGWLIERNEAAPESDQACTYRIRIEWIMEFVARRSNAQYYTKANVRSIYARQKGADPFLSGRSRTARRLNLLLPGLGETALRVLDILAGGEGWTRAEMVDECQKSAGGVGRICRRLEELEIIYSVREYPRQPKQYYLDPDAWAKVDDIRPQLRTYRLSAERRERALAEMQRRAEIQMDMADKPATIARKAQTIADAIGARRRLLAVIHPEWTAEETLHWILSPTPNARPWLNRPAGQYQTQAAANHLARQQVAPTLAYRMAMYAGYTEAEAGNIAKGVKDHKHHVQPQAQL